MTIAMDRLIYHFLTEKLVFSRASGLRSGEGTLRMTKNMTTTTTIDPKILGVPTRRPPGRVR